MNERIHFYLPYAKNPDDWPLFSELRKYGLNIRTISGGKSGLNFKHRFWLYIIGWPRLLFFSFKSGYYSLFGSDKPSLIVVGSDLEVLALSLIGLFLKRKPALILLGFIYTPRNSIFYTWIRQAYFNFILRQTKKVICYSKLETEEYCKLFKLKDTCFRFIPYGLNIHGIDQVFHTENYLFSAGRSQRDYHTLIRACVKLPYELRIVCDSYDILPKDIDYTNIKILRNCYAEEYIDQLRKSRLVVIPLKTDNISAGQMVLLQAMAFGKPIIITRTKTTDEYVHHLQNAYLVEKNSDYELKCAIELILTNDDLYKKLSFNARETFLENYSIEAYARNLAAELAQ